MKFVHAFCISACLFFTTYTRQRDRTLGAIVGGTVGGVVGALTADDSAKGAAHGLIFGAASGSILADDDYFYCDLSYRDLVEKLRATTKKLHRQKKITKKHARHISNLKKENYKLKKHLKVIRKEQRKQS